MKMIKVSVIIPVYNTIKYLPKCLDSVINQNYQNIEIILVDDGSSDGSEKICDDYEKKDSRVIVFHQENGGVSLARNNGIKKASGEYICFIDADDFVHSDYIKTLVDNLNENTLSICQIEKFQENVNIPINGNTGKKILDKDHFIDLCNMSLLNTPCCKLYNKNIIEKNKVFFDTKISLGEDLLFNLNYLKYIDKIVVANQKLYYYRRSEENTLSTLYIPNMLNIQLLLFDSYTKFFKTTSMDKDMLCTFDSYRFSMIMVIVANEFSNGELNFFKRYVRTYKLLKKDELKSRIKEIHYAEDKLYYFLIRYRLLFIYKIVNKVRSVLS